MNTNANKQEQDNSSPGLAATEADQLRRLADRMRRDGHPATGILLDNAAFLAEGGTMDEYEWAVMDQGTTDGRAEDTEVKESKRCGS